MSISNKSFKNMGCGVLLYALSIFIFVSNFMCYAREVKVSTDVAQVQTFFTEMSEQAAMMAFESKEQPIIDELNALDKHISALSIEFVNVVRGMHAQSPEVAQMFVESFAQCTQKISDTISLYDRRAVATLCEQFKKTLEQSDMSLEVRTAFQSFATKCNVVLANKHISPVTFWDKLADAGQRFIAFAKTPVGAGVVTTSVLGIGFGVNEWRKSNNNDRPSDSGDSPPGSTPPGSPGNELANGNDQKNDADPFTPTTQKRHSRFAQRNEGQITAAMQRAQAEVDKASTPELAAKKQELTGGLEHLEQHLRKRFNLDTTPSKPSAPLLSSDTSDSADEAGTSQQGPELVSAHTQIPSAPAAVGARASGNPPPPPPPPAADWKPKGKKSGTTGAKTGAGGSAAPTSRRQKHNKGALKQDCLAAIKNRVQLRNVSERNRSGNYQDASRHAVSAQQVTLRRGGGTPATKPANPAGAFSQGVLAAIRSRAKEKQNEPVASQGDGAATTPVLANQSPSSPASRGTSSVQAQILQTPRTLRMIQRAAEVHVTKNNVTNNKGGASKDDWNDNDGGCAGQSNFTRPNNIVIGANGAASPPASYEANGTHTAAMPVSSDDESDAAANDEEDELSSFLKGNPNALELFQAFEETLEAVVSTDEERINRITVLRNGFINDLSAEAKRILGLRENKEIKAINSLVTTRNKFRLPAAERAVNDCLGLPLSRALAILQEMSATPDTGTGTTVETTPADDHVAESTAYGGGEAADDGTDKKTADEVLKDTMANIRGASNLDSSIMSEFSDCVDDGDAADDDFSDIPGELVDLDEIALGEVPPLNSGEQS